MKRARFFKVTLLMAAMLSSTVTFGGAESSGGVEDYRDDTGAAWFLKFSGRTKIQACVRVSPRFGQGLEEAKAAVLRAVQIWDRYLRERAPHALVSLVADLEFVDSCSGKEDLAFYFGESDDRIAPVLSKYVSPLAIAERTQYDRKQGWGRGFIWVSPSHSVAQGYPDWSKPNHLTGILLHELGHVLGCEHIPGTIMDKTVSRFFKEPWFASEDLVNIDQERDLKGWGLLPRDFGPQFQGEAFKWLLKREPVGKYKVTLRTDWDRSLKNPRPVGTLILTDERETRSFQITTRVLVPMEFGLREYMAFKIDFEKVPSGTAVAFNSAGSSYLGELRDVDGQAYPLVWLRNASAKVELRLVPPTGTKTKVIFSSSSFRHDGPVSAHPVPTPESP